MDNSYGPLFAAHIGKIIFRYAAVAFIIGIVLGALIVWWF